MKRRELSICAVWSFQDLLRHLLSVDSMKCAEIAYRRVDSYITLLYESCAIGDAQQKAMRTLLAAAWDSVTVRLDGVKDSYWEFHYEI